MPFHNSYSKLCTTKGGIRKVNEKHEVKQIEKGSKTSIIQDIFEGTMEKKPQIRLVLMKGVAGVGKTMATQKFIQDWADGRANQDIDLLFYFTFKNLNDLQNSEYSLVGLLHHCFKESRRFRSFHSLKLVFIFDGLDEYKFPLDFSEARVLTKPTEAASVEVLLVNLFRGNLYPSARVWITTRPTATCQIPQKYISKVTQVHGFTDAQKEDYFRKRFKDEQATAIMSHIKSHRSLYIMSSIPIFCWIIATVLQNILEQTEKLQLPKTLTEMYVHFLVHQAKVTDGNSDSDSANLFCFSSKKTEK